MDSTKIAYLGIRTYVDTSKYMNANKMWKLSPGLGGLTQSFWEKKLHLHFSVFILILVTHELPYLVSEANFFLRRISNS